MLQNITSETLSSEREKERESILWTNLHTICKKKEKKKEANQWGVSRLAQHSVDFSYNWHRHFRRAWCIGTM